MAWRKKLKTQYYLRSEALKRAEVVSDEKLRDYVFDFKDGYPNGQVNAMY